MKQMLFLCTVLLAVCFRSNAAEVGEPELDTPFGHYHAMAKPNTTWAYFIFMAEELKSTKNRQGNGLNAHEIMALRRGMRH
jgi:hypothetical protein